MQPARFSDVTAISPVDDGRFEAHIHPEWTIGGKPNGGYLLAVMGRAAAQVSEHPHVIAASAHYLRPPDPAAVEVRTEILRAGRSATQLRAQLWQEGRLCVEALVTTARLDPDTKPFWSDGVPDAGDGRIEDAFRLPSRGPNGLTIPIMDQVRLELDPDCLGFAMKRPTGKGELRGWLELLGDEPFNTLSLLYAVDSFPPATLNVEITGWVPTLELTAYVRALPAPGPVRVLHEAHLIDAQRVDETCWVWDSTGRLVAKGVQLAGIRVG